LKIAIVAHCTVIVDPQRRNAQQHQFNLIYSIHHWKVFWWATILSQTIRVCLYSFSRCCLPNLRNYAKFQENSNL